MKHRALFSGPLVLAASLALAACSSDASPADPAEPPQTGGDNGAGGGDEGCKGEQREGAVCIESLEVSLADEAGGPVEGVTVFCCGTDICSQPVATDADGKAFIDVGLYMMKPAFKVEGRGDYISFAAPLPEGETNAVFPPATLVAFPDEGVAFEMGADQILESNGVTVEVSAATEIEIDELTLPEPEEQLFKAVEIPLDKAPPIGGPSEGALAAIYGLAPLSTTFDPPAKITLPNPDPALYPAGTPMKVYIHGIEIDEAFAPYSGWSQVDAGAVVSEDGERIILEKGLPILSTIGIGGADG